MTTATTTTKKPRKVLTLEERKVKLAKDKAKVFTEEAKIAVEETQSFLAAFKPSSVAKLFEEVRAQRKDVKDIDILRTLAKIAKVKAVITVMTLIPRAKGGDKATTAKKAAAKWTAANKQELTRTTLHGIVYSNIALRGKNICDVQQAKQNPTAMRKPSDLVRLLTNVAA